ncbi:Hypothetical protein RAK1035_1768 [Roseovarius sp. AK1035]|nr:Hypothetical protein RAK1035_1768 [Roseovarius sp. AK1035]
MVGSGCSTLFSIRPRIASLASSMCSQAAQWRGLKAKPSGRNVDLHES